MKFIALKKFMLYGILGLTLTPQQKLTFRPHLRWDIHECRCTKNEIRLLGKKVLDYHPYTENNMTCPKYVEYDIMIG